MAFCVLSKLAEFGSCTVTRKYPRSSLGKNSLGSLKKTNIVITDTMMNVQSAIAGFLKKDLTILMYNPNVLSYNLLNHLRLHFSSFKNNTHIAGVNIREMKPEITVAVAIVNANCL